MNAKEILTNFVPVIDKKLAEFWKTEIGRNFGYNEHQKKLVKYMLEHAAEHSLRSSKRLRGAFTYYGHLLGGEKNEEIWKAALGVEIVHTSLLMHDDFMDQDEVRRGKPTSHVYFANGDRHYGDSMALNLGDALLEIGQQLLIDSNFSGDRVLAAERKMLRGITNTAWGQAFDVSLEKNFEEMAEDDVIALHKAKTAIYTYENPLYIGAILAGLEGEIFDILTEYSMDGGVAFQLQDDILGVFGNPEKTGKSANSDLLQGKVTLLILKTFKDGSAKQIEDLKKVWGQRSAENEDIEKAKKAIIDCGSLQYSRDISRDYARKAANTAEKLRGLNLNTEAIDFIQGIAEYMVEREV